MTSTYVPPLITQLVTTNGKPRPDPTAGSDCAMSCAAEAIRFGTNGAVDPQIDKVREMSGLDEPNPPPSDFSTTIQEYAQAVNSFDARAREAGYDGIGAGIHERQPWDELEPVLKEGKKWVTLYVNYGVLNDREPGKSGDPNFRGAHAIGVFGYKPASQTNDGTVKYKVWDSLCDGARGAPKGPTWWKASTLRDAADAYAKDPKDRLVTWCTTPRSKRLEPEPPDPEPEPPVPCEETVAMAYDLLGQAIPFLNASKDERALRQEIQEFLPDTREGRKTKVKPGVK